MNAIQIEAGDQTYELISDPNEPMLHAGLRQGVALPYACATGTCGECAASLVSGSIYDAWPEAPGKKSLKKNGTGFLMCQYSAIGDCLVRLPRALENPLYDPNEPGKFAGTVVGCKNLTQDVRLLEVGLDRPCQFDAGQFMLVEAPGVVGARGYSMVNFAKSCERLTFLIKRKPGGGFSEWLFGGDIQGEKLKLFGPVGGAVFRPQMEKDILCVAGGSGIAGLMSILDCASASGHFERHKGHVVFGVRTVRDAFFLDELSDLVRAHDGAVEVVIALSDEKVPADLVTAFPAISFVSGMVHEALANEAAGLGNVHAFVAGPPPSVDEVQKTLVIKAKLSPAFISFDKFY